MTHIRHISRTASWAICKLFFIFYITIPLLSLPLVVIDAFFHPTGPTLAWLAWVFILAPIAVLGRRAYIRFEQ